jgi:hypothetical protein
MILARGGEKAACISYSHRPRIEIQPEHWKLVSDIFCRHVPHFDMWAVGSRARFTAKKDSDLDLVAVTERPLPVSLCAAIVQDCGPPLTSRKRSSVKGAGSRQARAARQWCLPLRSQGMSTPAAMPAGPSSMAPM